MAQAPFVLHLCPDDEDFEIPHPYLNKTLQISVTSASAVGITGASAEDVLWTIDIRWERTLGRVETRIVAASGLAPTSPLAAFNAARVDFEQRSPGCLRVQHCCRRGHEDFVQIEIATTWAAAPRTIIMNKDASIKM